MWSIHMILCILKEENKLLIVYDYTCYICDMGERRIQGLGLGLMETVRLSQLGPQHFHCLDILFVMMPHVDIIHLNMVGVAK